MASETQFKDPSASDIRQKLLTIITEDPKSWDKAWKENITPWDRHGKPQPALVELVETEASKKFFPTHGTALVPGCGTGYDVAFFASALGLDVTGLEISETAKEAAERYLASQASSAGSAQVIIGDFFTHKEKYDLVYDYTFFVALPPSWRSKWGAQMGRLVKSGAVLVTLMFPYAEIPEGYVGPPWPATLNAYTEALGEHWEKLWDGIPNEALAMPGTAGKQHIAIWKKL